MATFDVNTFVYNALDNGYDAEDTLNALTFEGTNYFLALEVIRKLYGQANLFPNKDVDDNAYDIRIDGTVFTLFPIGSTFYYEF